MFGSVPRQWPALDVRAGALPFRLGQTGQSEILLIRRLGRHDWSIPKGRLMAFREPHEAARIEAHEEAGIYGRVGSDPIGSYLHVKAPGAYGRRNEVVEVVVFPLEVDRIAATWPEMALRERQWLPPADAITLVGSGKLREIIAGFAPALADQQIILEANAS